MEHLQPWQRDVQRAPTAAKYSQQVREMTTSQVRREVQTELDIVSKRLDDLHTDAGPLDQETGQRGTPLFERENHWGRMSAGGHVEQLIARQTRLRVALKEYVTRGGNPRDIHPEAWKRATTRHNRASELRRPGGDGPGTDGGGGRGRNGGGDGRGGQGNGNGGQHNKGMAPGRDCQGSGRSAGGLMGSELASTGLMPSYASACGSRGMACGREFGRGPGGVAVPRGRIEGLVGAPEVLAGDGLSHSGAVDVVFAQADAGALQTWAQEQLGLAPRDLVRRVVAEVAGAVATAGAYPFFSLHFADTKELYPVIHPVYRHTVTGHIISTLDYFLKGFLNGGVRCLHPCGLSPRPVVPLVRPPHQRERRRAASHAQVYSPAFLASWGEGARDTSRDTLRGSVIDLKRLLQREQPELEYVTLREDLTRAGLSELVGSAGENEGQNSSHDGSGSGAKRQRFMTAFRIIGKLPTAEREGALVVCRPTFDVEYDIETTPHYQKQLNEYMANHGTTAAVWVPHVAHCALTRHQTIPDFALPAPLVPTQGASRRTSRSSHKCTHAPKIGSKP